MRHSALGYQNRSLRNKHYPVRRGEYMASGETQDNALRGPPPALVFSRCWKGME